MGDLSICFDLQNCMLQFVAVVFHLRGWCDWKALSEKNYLSASPRPICDSNLLLAHLYEMQPLLMLLVTPVFDRLFVSTKKYNEKICDYHLAL